MDTNTKTNRRRRSTVTDDRAKVRKELNSWVTEAIAKIEGHKENTTMDTREERARETARNLADAANEMGFDTEAFADELLRQHRTIQQSAFGAFLATVKAWAALPPSRFDARNEFTVAKSREIVEALGEYNLRVPFI